PFLVWFYLVPAVVRLSARMLISVGSMRLVTRSDATTRFMTMTVKATESRTHNQRTIGFRMVLKILTAIFAWIWILRVSLRGLWTSREDGQGSTVNEKTHPLD